MLGKKILFCSSDEHGCGWYRTKLIADYLQVEHVWYFPAVKDPLGNLHLGDKRVDEADVIVIQRHSNEFFLEAIPTLQAQGKKIVYDLDDNLWNIPASNPAHNLFPSKGLKTTKKIIQLCDYVTVSTQPLMDWMLREGFNKNIIVIPNMIEDVLPFRERANDKIRIGYAGSPTHVGDFNYKLCDALRKAKREFDCELVFMGYNPIKGGECEFHTGCKVEEYLVTLNNLNLDIAIAPLANNLFNQCKSNLKFLEYSACGFATIASDVYPYTYTVDAPENGYLIDNDKTWYTALYTLIKVKEKRDQFSKQSWEFVRDNFTYKYAGQLIRNRWESIIREMYA